MKRQQVEYSRSESDLANDIKVNLPPKHAKL